MFTLRRRRRSPLASAGVLACAWAFAQGVALGEPANAVIPLPPVAAADEPPLAAEPSLFADDALQPAAFQTRTGQIGWLSGAQSGPLARSFSALAPGSPTSLANDFVADPEFTGGIVVIGRDAAMKIGGYVKADLIQDFNAIESPDSFVTTEIPTDGTDYQNARFHARQSRFSFDTRWQGDGQPVRAFVETDFFGDGADGSSALRLRHAYGRIGRFTAGQTWTTFTDPAAVPQTLDFEGAVSNVNRRQGLVRWTQPLPLEGSSLAVALENPQINVIAPPALPGTGRTETPDFIARLRWEDDWGEFQAAGITRELGFQPDGQGVLTATAWGFNFTGSFLLLEETKAYYQITFGEGIGSYRGSPDVIPTGPMTATVLPVFGWMVGGKHQWTDRLTSNITFSELSLDVPPGAPADSLRGTTYLAVNLIYNPLERVFCGVEYLYGVHEVFSGAEGSANRLQFSFGYFLP